MKTWVLFFLVLTACSEPRGLKLDASTTDILTDNLNDATSDALSDAPNDTFVDVGGLLDAPVFDAPSLDGNPLDAVDPSDANGDAPRLDAAADAGTADAGTADAGTADAGTADAGTADGGNSDAGVDAGPTGGCISGASGTHVVRFTWQGSGSGSTAYVSYDTSSLPDTSVWRVSAGSGNIGYRPVFSDIFLGEGGLEMGSGVFIDVLLTTVGLSAIDGITLSVYGRSFNTTSPGSFTWQSFEGTGASPSGNVSNSAPYEWYSTSATGAIAAGDDGVRLRLRAGPPSGRLIVRRVEICFDAR